MQESPSADDRDGRTGLLLLTHVSHPRAVLFMLSGEDGVVTASAMGQAGFHDVGLAMDALPFAHGTFDAVVLDIDSIHLTSAVRTRVLLEVRRILRPGGQCVIAAASRRIPRDWRNWRQYHLVGADRRWPGSLAARTGFSISCRMFARLDGKRVVELMASADGLPPSAHDTITDQQIMVLRRSGEPEDRSFLQKLIAELQVSLDPPERRVSLKRLLIRRIGKTTLVVARDDERRYVVRVARTAIAAERGRQNFRALAVLQSTNVISDQMKAMVPRPVLAGSVDHYPYYVEEAMPGTSPDNFHGWLPGTGWEPWALGFIAEMHAATKRPVFIDRKVFDAVAAAPLARIARWCATLGAVSVLDKLSEMLKLILVGETVPFVWSHGDFSAGNCLYDGARRLSAVVDWELFSDYHLPLLDVLNVMEIPDERNSQPTWQRFDTICAMFCQGSAPDTPVLASYVDRLGIPRRVLPALGAMYWIDHVAKRIDARGDDRVWMRKRVLQPLSTLASVDLK